MGLYTGVLNLPSGENGMEQLLAAAHMGNPKAQGFLALIAMKHHEYMTDEDARLYAMQAADGKEIAQWQAIYQGSEHTEVWDRFFRMNMGDRERMLSDILAVETTVQYGIHETAADVKEVEFIRGRAENGDRTAQYNLGLLYLDGEGVPKNIEAGSRMILKSAYQDYTPAYYMAGKLFYDGRGVQRDHVVAYPTLI
jgi:TPR repeat protein